MKEFYRNQSARSRESFVEVATSMIGSIAVKYTPGHPELGQSPEQGFDCSGFVRYVLEKADINIPDYLDINGGQKPIRHANEFFDHYGIAVHHDLHEPGDLIFFSRDGYSPTHVGIVIDLDNYIHSPGKRGSRVRVDPIEEESILPLKAGGLFRILYSKNPIGYKSPAIPIDSDSRVPRYSQIPLP